mgnify:CR=1 FL=1
MRAGGQFPLPARDFTPKGWNAVIETNLTGTWNMAIEAKNGIHFGELASVDPLAGDEEGVSDAVLRTPLLALEQIRFVR